MEWLRELNRGQDRLPERRFELLLWRLEIANADATNRTLTAAGVKSLTGRYWNKFSSKIAHVCMCSEHMFIPSVYCHSGSHVAMFCQMG